jgi:hypothetical protein
LVRREYYTSADIRDAQATGGGIPMMGAPGVVPGPPGVAPGLAVPPPAAANGFPSDRSVIVLNNSKPAAKSAKKKEAFSFRNIKRSIVPSSSITPMQEPQDQLHVPFNSERGRRDSHQFTIGFRLGPDGNIVDIESQIPPQPPASPTPTFINGNGSQVILFDSSNQQQQQQLKRKPITKDDNHYKHDDSNKDNYY